MEVVEVEEEAAAVALHRMHHHCTRMEVLEEGEETEETAAVGVHKIHHHSSRMKEVGEAYGNAMHYAGRSQNLEEALRTWNLFAGWWASVGSMSLGDRRLGDGMD
jgi:hypothetical protein